MNIYEVEKDAIALWVRTVRPGRRTNAELAESYDDWSDRTGAPEIRNAWTLSRALSDLGYKRWRTTHTRGIMIPSRHRQLLEKAGPVTRGAAYFVGRAAPGHWTAEQVSVAYGNFAQDLGITAASKGWLVEILREIGVPTRGDGFDIGGVRQAVEPLR